MLCTKGAGFKGGVESGIVNAKGKSELIELLFVQQADRATLENGVLTLEGVGSNVLYFSDRPERIVGRETLDEFIDNWDEGEESFESIPPNAVITVVKGDEELDAVFILKNPVRIAADRMTYNVEVLEGPEAGFGDHARLLTGEIAMKKTILTGVIATGSLSLALTAPHASADYIFKSFPCPGNGKVVVPTGSRFDIDDIIISTTKDQNITLKFMPGNRIFTRVFLKTRVPFVANFSGEVESNEEQGLQLDCAGVAGTTVTITVTGNGNL